MIASQDVVDCYRRLLFRDPLPEDVGAYMLHAPSVRRLEQLLCASVEFQTLIEPVRRLLMREWRTWLFREPTDSELRVAIDRTRGRCGTDDGLRMALRDGSIRTKLAFRPLKIEMDITNQCNLRCIMCHFSQPEYHDAKRKHISVEKFAAIAEQAFHRAHQVSLSYGTEPLLHKDIDQLLAILARSEVPHKYLNTNGLLLQAKTIEAMIEHGFDFLLVSVDAATKETYERIRIGGSFEKLVANLRLLREIKAAHGVSHPRVGLGFVIMRPNLAELPQFLDFAAAVGASSVNATHMVVWETVGNAPLAVDRERQRCNEALAAARCRAAALGITFVGPAPFEAAAKGGALVADTVRRGREYGLEFIESPPGSCPFPWAFAAIDPEGEVMPCGWWDATVVGSMGNIYKRDFATIWRGRRFRQLRKRLRNHRLEGSCARCPAAGMGSPDSSSAFLAV